MRIKGAAGAGLCGDDVIADGVADQGGEAVEFQLLQDGGAMGLGGLD